MASEQVKVFQIGPDGTEYYAAHSEQEMRDWYAKTVGGPEAAEDLQSYFEEVTDIDVEFNFSDEGKERRMTWRQLVLECDELPCQISTGYN